MSENSIELRRPAMVVLQQPTEPVSHVDNTFASGICLERVHWLVPDVGVRGGSAQQTR